MSAWTLFSSLIGWMYITAWSVSFYPQLILNHRRKSVTGLSMDFLFLNVLGFACYITYAIAFLASKSIQSEYQRRHPGSAGPLVRLNDAVFAGHALVLSTMTLFQAYMLNYERARTQRLSQQARAFLIAALIAIITLVTLAELYKIQWIDVIYSLSYLKLLISFLKMIPQLHLNYTRKSTRGWSITNIFLDLTGGSLSLLRR